MMLICSGWRARSKKHQTFSVPIALIGLQCIRARWSPKHCELTEVMLFSIMLVHHHNDMVQIVTSMHFVGINQIMFYNHSYSYLKIIRLQSYQLTLHAQSYLWERDFSFVLNHRVHNFLMKLSIWQVMIAAKQSGQL